MAHLYKPTYTRNIPAKAEFFTENRIRYAKWKGRKNKEFIGRMCEDDETRCLVEVDCWWCEYEDHNGDRRREKCHRDRLASERKMWEIVARVERIRAGILTEASQNAAGRDLADMVREWRADMEARDLSSEHVKTSFSRVTATVAEVGAVRPVDLTVSAVGRALKVFRGREVEPISPQTSNHYLAAVHSFTNWCVVQRYCDADPLAGAAPLEVDSRRTFERRALTAEEITKLLDATRTNTLHRCPLSGPDRAALYLAAIYTGLRAGSLASLTRASFQLDGDHPTITVRARDTKTKKAKAQPIPASISAKLREWLDTRPATGRVWPGYNWADGGAADMLRRDMEAAGIEPDTEAGRVDFHALRTSYATLLALAGVPIQHAQELMGHTSGPALMMKYYVKLTAGDLSGQVNKLA